MYRQICITRLTKIYPEICTFWVYKSVGPLGVPQGHRSFLAAKRCWNIMTHTHPSHTQAGILIGYEGSKMCPTVEPTSAMLRLNELLSICLECPELKIIAKESITIDFRRRPSPQEILKLLCTTTTT